MAENPSRIVGLYPRKGAIRVGADADLTIWDPEGESTIEAVHHLGIAGFTPYEGWTVRGRPWMTLVRGQTMLSEGRIHQKPVFGRYLSRPSPPPSLACRAR